MERLDHYTIRHYVARRAQVIEDHPHNAADRVRRRGPGARRGRARVVGWRPRPPTRCLMVLARCQASGVATFRAEQFSVSVSDEVLADLRARIRNTRWPGPTPGAQWEQGTDLGYLRGLLGYWADGFDWRAQERWLNGFGHFRAGIDDVRVHFVHERARGGRGIPLILTNGWPSCFAEFLPLVPRLTDPAAHGIDGPGFDVVIPSLPGYGFSDRPARTGDMPLYGGAVAPPDARPGISAIRRARRRLRFRRHDVHGAGRPGAHARYSPVQPGSGALYRAGVTAAVRGRAGLPGPVPAMA